MKRLHLLSLLSALLLVSLFSACNGKKGPFGGNNSEENVVVVPDTSIYARLVEFDNDSLLFISENGVERITCAYHEASTNGQIFGSLTEGNLFSIQLSPGTHDARHLVNLSQLSGQWFYDDENGRGFELNIDGHLSPINNGELSFRKWKIYNGHLIFYYTDEQTVARSESTFLNDTTDILELPPEDLVFNLLGETYHCQRKHEAIKVHFNF